MNELATIKWCPGTIVKVIPSGGGEERIFVYVQKNYLADDKGNRYWFNESLFPYPQKGYILFINLDEKPNSNLSYEIIEILPK